jgi:hypothetical protein
MARARGDGTVKLGTSLHPDLNGRPSSGSPAFVGPRPSRQASSSTSRGAEPSAPASTPRRRILRGSYKDSWDHHWQVADGVATRLAS